MDLKCNAITMSHKNNGLAIWLQGQWTLQSITRKMGIKDNIHDIGFQEQ